MPLRRSLAERQIREQPQGGAALVERLLHQPLRLALDLVPAHLLGELLDDLAGVLVVGGANQPLVVAASASDFCSSCLALMSSFSTT
jgi:hypothetical protein